MSLAGGARGRARGSRAVARRGVAGQRRCDGRLPLPGPFARAVQPQGGKERMRVLVNGDAKMDLAGKTEPLGSGMKKIWGVILILAINLAGIAIIVKIWRKGE